MVACLFILLFIFLGWEMGYNILVVWLWGLQFGYENNVLVETWKNKLTNSVPFSY